MLTKEQFFSFLAKRGGTFILDGALATELESRGQNLNHPLWSGLTLQNSPELIGQVHKDYFLAGADVGITASYQTSIPGLEKHFGLKEDEAEEWVARSVRLCREAALEVEREKMARGGLATPARRLLIAGSVGPYGAFLADGSEYSGSYSCSEEEFKDFHRGRLSSLVKAGVDLVAFETMPSFSEIKALVELVKEPEFEGVVGWVSVTIRDAKLLADGTPLEEVLWFVGAEWEGCVGFGVNCVPRDQVKETLGQLQSVNDKKIPLVCYPNSGEVWDGVNKVWMGGSGEGTGGEEAREKRETEYGEWVRLGARLIGGCCRTGPRDIEDVARAVGRRVGSQSGQD
jgi:homocysteine S-methyltransferase